MVVVRDDDGEVECANGHVRVVHIALIHISHNIVEKIKLKCQ